MLTRILILLLGAGVLVVGLCAGLALAGGPVFWETSKQEEVAKGDARGVSIAESGTITLAPAYPLVYDTKEAYIWSSATDASGNIFLGTGHEGRIFIVDRKGSGRMLYDAPELDVTALATDPQGNLYAGTSPDGKIYKITPDGKASVFSDPDDKYIWSLAYEAATSTLYAGTGNKGIIYSIDSSGKATVLADTNETNIVSLALEQPGRLLAGTDPSGLVLRVSRDGKTFALIDSPLQEIHKIVLGADGAIFALGINAQPASAQRQGSIGVSTTTSISAEGVITISSEEGDEAGGQVGVQSASLAAMLGQPRVSARNLEGAKAAVFRITADGASEAYWVSKDATAFGLWLAADGNILVGTGSKGRIYSIAPDRSPTLLIQSPEEQTSELLAVGGEVYAASSNLGRLYRVARTPVNEGIYESVVRDAKFASQWGSITWRGAGDVSLQTRTGNTETPDATWSDWSAPYGRSSGEQISSPRARFIQWRATLRAQSAQTSEKARLHSVVVAYLPRNQAPEVTSISALPPGVALQEMPLAVDPSIASSGLDPQLFGVAVNVPPRRFFQKGSRSLFWQASDPNDDSLVYRLYYRTIGDSGWHLLADNFGQTYYTIDGNRLPDGTYLFKVEASDSLSNPEAIALAADCTTEPVEIDNTPPVVNTGQPITTGQTTELVFDVHDTTSRVVRGEYSVDGGPWQLIFPQDGIADSAAESYKVAVTFTRKGEHVIAFRAADSSSNVGTSKVTVAAP